MNRPLLRSLAAVVLTTGLLAACGDDKKNDDKKNDTKTSAAANDPYGTPAGGTTAPGGTTAGAGTGAAPGGSSATATISGFAFQLPASVTPGAQISVTNDDGASHTLTADDGSFTVSVGGGKTATVTAPATAGSYPVHCEIHSSMKGALVVSG